jgi:hypothetical protein
VRLSHQAARDLQSWITFSADLLQGCPILPTVSEAIMHTDVAEVGWGGTFGVGRGVLGGIGDSECQGLWDWEDRSD